jgi:hypothetical protein
LARFRLRYVNSFANADRSNAKVRHYFRRPGAKAIPLPGLPGSEEFMVAYAAALAGMPDAAKAEIGASRTLPGTIDALVLSFYQTNNKWLNVFQEETRRAWRPHIERFRERHGSKRVRLLRREHIVKMLAEIDKPHVRLNWLKAIRALLRHAVPTMLPEDPTVGSRSRSPGARAGIPGSTRRSRNTALIGAGAPISGSSSSSHMKPPRGPARSRGSGLSMSISGQGASRASASPERTEATTSTSR